MQITRAKATSDDGFIIVNKDKDMTSHDVVACMRKLCNTRKIGHGGTLDPMATGVLVIAVGRATKFLQYVSACQKSYRASIMLGVKTVTDDAMGEIVCKTPVVFDSLQEKLDEIYKSFRGDILQVPSSVSAIKVDGKRAYDLVRKGEKVELKPREITIYSLEQTCPLRICEQTQTVEFDIEVTCSAGTYIRSIARDIGDLLGCGGHLTALQRTNVGNFALDDSVTLRDLDSFVLAQNCTESPKAVEVLPLVDVACKIFPHVNVNSTERSKIRVGGFLPYDGFVNNAKSIDNNNVDRFDSADIYVAICEDDCDITSKKLVALMTPKGKYVKPVCVFDV